MLTASELIEELSKIPAETVVVYTTRDSDYGVTYYKGISGVSPIGTLIYAGIRGSVDDYEDYDD
jgi:hypothetical protein